MIRLLPPWLGVALAVAAAGNAAGPTQDRANTDPAWSPDGTRIAFVSTAAGGIRRDLWTMRADGTGLAALTVGANVGAPAWSPDGTRLAFTSEPAGAPTVEVIDADGAGRRVVAAGSAPAWAPDGGRIAYDGAGGVRVLELDTGRDRLVAPAWSGHTNRPAWSPDGRRLAYVDERDVWVAGADGAGPRRLTAFPQPRSAGAPAWSPDGSTLVFVVGGPATAPEPSEVWIVGADGTGVRRLLSAAFIPGAAVWAPDGRSVVLAAALTRDGDVELRRAAVPDGPVVALENDDVWDETPAFAPDGRRLAWVVRHGRGYLLSDVWTLDLETDRRRNLTGTASGRTIDARAVRPPARLTLPRVAAWLDRSFARPLLRIEVRVSDTARDEVRGAVVRVVLATRGLVRLSPRVTVTDVHGNTEHAFRVRRPGVVRVGSRVRVLVSARPRGSAAPRVAVSRELRLVVAARAPLG